METVAESARDPLVGCPGCDNGQCVDDACPPEHRAFWKANTMKSYLCKFVRKQTVSLYVEAPSANQAEEMAKEMAVEFLGIDEDHEEDLKEDLDGGTVKISSRGCNSEVTKYASEETCDVEP